MGISEYVYEVLHPTVLDRIVTVSGALATKRMTSLSWFSFFNPNVIALGIKYYRNVVKTSCEIMRQKLILQYSEKGDRWSRKFQIWL